MKKFFSWNILLGIFFLGMLPFVNALNNPLHSIDKCQTLDKAGTTYVLSKDISTTENICFNIVASGVTLDLNGKNVSGNKEGYGVYVNGLNGGGLNGANSLIKNGYIYGFGIGIYLSSSSDNTVTNNILNDNGYGINLVSGSNNIIISNTLNSNDPYGISVDSSSDNTITNNILNNNRYGINIFSGSTNTVTNNLVNDNGYGIYLDLGPRNSLIMNNTLNSNSQDSIYLSAYNNTITNNIIWNCSSAGTYSCIKIYRSDKNTFDSNEIDQSSNYGIWIRSAGSGASDNADHNVFRDTAMTNIASTAVFIDDDSNSENLNNTFINFTYNSESVDSRSQLFRKWYYRAYVEDSSGNPVSNAKVTVYDRNNALRHSLTSGSDGYTEIVEIIDYYRTGSTKNHYSLYNIYVTKEGIEEELKKEYNVTSQQNNLKHVFTFGSNDKPPKDKCEGADISKNGRVGSEDTRLLLKNYGRRNCTKINNWCNRADINKNGRVELNDLKILRKNLGKKNCS